MGLTYDYPAGKPVLLLSVHNAQDRKLIKQFLPDSLTIKTSRNGIAGRAFDLCVLDHSSFEANKQALQELKGKAAPIFLPFLLLSQNKKAIKNSDTVLEFADDVVHIPASPKLLQSRISLLLKQREYSLKLEEKNKELAKEKKEYQLITENATDMISLHAPDGTYLYVSPACKELTGYEPEDLLGQKPFNNMHPHDRKIFESPEEHFADKQIKRFTFRKGTISGDYKWVESIMRPIVDDETGEVTEIQASTRDISERKKFEQKLKEEKNFIDKAIQSMPELFYMIDENQNFIKWNNIERVLGYSDEEMQDMHPVDLFREEDHEFITNKFQEVFDTGFTELEVEIESKGGELIPHLVTARKFTRGETDFIVGTAINLSEIKETQYELEQHRQLLDAIINQSKSLIFVKDQDKKYRLVNDSYIKLFDLEREDILGKSVREVHGREFERQVEENDDAVLKYGKTVEIEEAIPVDGEIRYYHSIKYPLKGVPGYENCLCGISTDITDLKRATNQLQERIKEQRCLYNISSLSDRADTVEELLAKAVKDLQKGWQHPEITEAAITYGEQTFKTEGFCESQWKLSIEQHQVDDKLLSIDIIYTEKRPQFDEEPFLDEERELINSIAETLSSQIKRIHAQKNLEESEKRWGSLVKNDPNLIQILDPEGTIVFINQAGAELLGKDQPDALIGENYYSFFELDDDKRALSETRAGRVLQGERVDSQVYQITRLDGEKRYIQSQAMPITLEDGRPGVQQVAQDITERMMYEEELRESLHEKEILLQEIHHRVKNNLAVVSGMLQLQAFKSENNELQKSLRDSESRIKTMALIHEKLYQSKSLSNINFGSYVEELIENIKEVTTRDKSIQISFDYDSFNLNVNQAVPCALILNEILSNAYEHAFTNQREGVVNISLKESNEIIYVRISDNGKGLPSEFDKTQDQTMGFTIIQTLIKQLEADFEVKNDNGTTILFSFKRQEIKGSSSSLV